MLKNVVCKFVMLNRLILTAEQADTLTHLFRRFGYNGAPLDQIAAAAGLSPEQVSAQLGGRNGLFLALLHHYRLRLAAGTLNFAPQGSSLTGSHLTGSHLTGSHLTGSGLTGSRLTGSHLQALERLFVGLIAAQGDADLPPGYLIIATAGEINGQDLVLNAAVQSYFDEIRFLLTGTVRRAADAGDLLRGVDCEAAGDFLFGALLALRMMHKIKTEPLIQRNFVSGVMHYLQRLKRSSPQAELEENTSPT